MLAERGVATAGLEVILTETGYELGDGFYPDYSPISEELRAQYIQRALDDYWSTWPEVRAVTPFQLAGWYGSWRTFDWVWPSSTTTRHGLPTQPRLQYARLVPDTGVVVGTVYDDSGTPLQDASIVSEPGGYEARTLADGSFVLLANPGTYGLTVEKPGYGTATVPQVAVIEGQSSRLGLSLPARLPETLVNASFETGDLSGWTPWGDVDGVQAAPWFFDVEARAGGRFLGTAVNCGAKDGGVQQSLAARPGSDVVVRAWTLTARDGTASVRNRIGVDPRGGTDPRADRIVWSPWVETGGQWQHVDVRARAEADRITIFLEHDQDAQNPWNVSAFDGVEVVRVPGH